MTPSPAAAAAEALPRRRPATRRAPVRHPRRISGPARPIARPGARPRTAPRVAAKPDSRGLALRAIAAYERVCDSALLDRLVRGRLWIGLLAFSLIGIVAMQLMVLKLNNGIGATLQRAAALQRANAQLGIEAATGGGEGRIEPLAAATGMTFAPPGSVHFVASSPANDINRAAAALAAPIQPREYTAPGSEAGAGAGEAAPGSGEASGGEASAGSGEALSGQAPSGQAGSGESGSGSGEASGSSSPASEAGAAGSGEAGALSESRGAQAGSAGTGESEASASAAGGVAAGH